MAINSQLGSVFRFSWNTCQRASPPRQFSHMALFVNVLNSFNKRPKNKKIIKAISFVPTLTALTAVSRSALFAGPRQDPTVGCFALIRATGHATILWPEIDTMKWPQRSQSGHSASFLRMSVFDHKADLFLGPVRPI